MQALGRNSKRGVLEVVPQMKMDFFKRTGYHRRLRGILNQGDPLFESIYQISNVKIN